MRMDFMLWNLSVSVPRNLSIQRESLAELSS